MDLVRKIDITFSSDRVKIWKTETRIELQNCTLIKSEIINLKLFYSNMKEILKLSTCINGNKIEL